MPKPTDNMPKPTDVKDVRRLCGFINYLAKFMPHLSDVMEPLRQLTHKEAEWKWMHEHNAATMLCFQATFITSLLACYYVNITNNNTRCPNTYIQSHVTHVT